MSEYKVYYFDTYGYAECIRILLDYVKANWEDVRLSREEFQKLKADGKFEFGQVPALEHEGKVYTQTMAILRSLGANNGLYSPDPITMWKIDSIIDAIKDINQVFFTAFMKQDEEEKKKAI